jgi:hypothetical protein
MMNHDATGKRENTSTLGIFLGAMALAPAMVMGWECQQQSRRVEKRVSSRT